MLACFSTDFVCFSLYTVALFVILVLATFLFVSKLIHHFICFLLYIVVYCLKVKKYLFVLATLTDFERVEEVSEKLKSLS